MRNEHSSAVFSNAACETCVRAGFSKNCTPARMRKNPRAVIARTWPNTAQRLIRTESSYPYLIAFYSYNYNDSFH